MKTYEAPLKAVWDRMEYLRDKKDLAMLEDRPFTTFIFCSNCRREIKDRMINVVAFGKEVVCGSCFGKKWAKIKNRIAKFSVPEALQEAFEQVDSPEYLEQVAQDKKDLAELQKKAIAQIRNAGAKEGPTE